MTKLMFQSTPPRGGRQADFVVSDGLSDVSIHAPARGATQRSANTGMPSTFQSTPPRGGRRSAASDPQTSPCFNPRPRAGGDCGAADDAGHQWVSIHAPARGATGRQRNHVEPNDSVSIHAPARGATDCTVPHYSLHVFQSTPPRGGRHRRRKMTDQIEVSIHAPARGATFGGPRTTRRP